MKSLFHLTLVLAIFASSSAFAFGINSPFRRHRGNIRGPIYGVPGGGFYPGGVYPGGQPGYFPQGPVGGGFPGGQPGFFPQGPVGGGPVGGPVGPGGYSGYGGGYGPNDGYTQPGLNQGGYGQGDYDQNNAYGNQTCSARDASGQYFQGQGNDGNQAAQQALQNCYAQSNNNCQLAGCP